MTPDDLPNTDKFILLGESEDTSFLTIYNYSLALQWLRKHSHVQHEIAKIQDEKNQQNKSV